MGDSTCSIEGCGKRAEKRTWCAMHYRRWHRTGDPHKTLPQRGGLTGPSVAETFWDHVDKDDPAGCWLWLRPSNGAGYGQLRFDGRTRQSHRVAYEMLLGPIPNGLQLDHLCRNRACVNPRHLEPVTARVNTLRGETLPSANAAKTHCPQGHPYDEANTRMNSGHRQCRTCDRARHQRRKNPT
jgi:hypothetical protein